MTALGSDWSAAWRQPQHRAEFDLLGLHNERRVRRHWERYNEVNLFRAKANSIQGNDLLDLGCATGEFYRYVRAVLSRFRYHGCDIDEQLVNRARQKYPGTHFFQSTEDLSNIRAHCPYPSVVFSRDVVPFCAEPFAHLRKLLALPLSAAVIRLRTRDQGASELDPGRSCAFLHGKWIPYMVLNTDELVSCITAIRPIADLYLYKNYEILGGEHRRFLPKECYYPETGTASTAIFIHFSESQVTPPRIVIKAQPDAAQLIPLWRRGLRRLEWLAPNRT